MRWTATGPVYGRRWEVFPGPTCRDGLPAAPTTASIPAPTGTPSEAPPGGRDTPQQVRTKGVQVELRDGPREAVLRTSGTGSCRPGRLNRAAE